MPRPEFKVTVEMDRIPSPTQTYLEQRLTIAEDNHLLAHFRRGRGCGCAGCQAQAKAAREDVRGQELPTDAQGKPLDPFKKGK